MKIRNHNVFSFIKFLLLAGVIVLFIGLFLKIYISIPNNLSLKVIFIIFYLWFTLGINVNFVMPLIAIINKEINQRNG
tara:strand:- start:459 stop:692 length:234 start_codon:yes stop_codon:yes gene_type:complete